MKKTMIIIPTHSSYLDVVDNFLEVLEKKWKNHPEVLISYTGECTEINGYNYHFNGGNKSLIECILNVCSLYNDVDYFYCLLGDAFITKNISDEKLSYILEEMYNNDLGYCSLVYFDSINQIKTVGRNMRYIYSKDRHNVNFISFIASRDFIENELLNDLSDLNFEEHYLQLSNKTNEYFYDKATLIEDMFGIIAAINKGKWERKKIKILKKKYPDIVFSNRKKLNLIENLKLNTMLFLRNNISNKQRLLLKKIMRKMGCKFPSNF